MCKNEECWQCRVCLYISQIRTLGSYRTVEIQKENFNRYGNFEVIFVTGELLTLYDDDSKRATRLFVGLHLVRVETATLMPLLQCSVKPCNRCWLRSVSKRCRSDNVMMGDFGASHSLAINKRIAKFNIC